MKEIIKKDKYGNVVYKKNENMTEVSKYDYKGNKTYYKNTLFGTEWNAKYEKKVRKLHYKDLNLGDEYWIDYKTNGSISKILKKVAGSFYLNGKYIGASYEK